MNMKHQPENQTFSSQKIRKLSPYVHMALFILYRLHNTSSQTASIYQYICIWPHTADPELTRFPSVNETVCGY